METKRQNIDTGNTNEPQYVCTQNGTAKTTISKKEEKYKSNLKGTKLTILKKTEKNLLKIVNLYAPHCETTNKNPEITVNFYNDLNNLLNQINNKSSIVLVAGNFNGETGKKTDRQMFRGFLWRKKKPKGTTSHKFMHKSRLINNKRMLQAQRKKVNNMGTNSYCIN